MYNWSTDQKQFKNKDSEEVWKLEQLINYGLNGSKIDRKKLLRFWPSLSLDPNRRHFIQFLLNADPN